MSQYVDEVIYQHNGLAIYNNIFCGYKWGQHRPAHRNENWRDMRNPLSFLNSVTPNYSRTSLKLEPAEKSENLFACVIFNSKLKISDENLSKRKIGKILIYHG